MTYRNLSSFFTITLVYSIPVLSNAFFIPHTFKTFQTPLKASNNEHTITLQKPIGLILEEVDPDNPNGGIFLASMDPNGAAAAASSSDLCLRDVITAINGVPCQNERFEEIMDRIISSPGDEITLTVCRRKHSVVVQWPNGIHVACMPGESIGEVAQLACYPIKYSCLNGGCGTCEQSVILDGDERRYIRPCVGRVPAGCKSMTVVRSDRYDD